MKARPKKKKKTHTHKRETQKKYLSVYLRRHLCSFSFVLYVPPDSAEHWASVGGPFAHSVSSSEVRPGSSDDALIYSLVTVMHFLNYSYNEVMSQNNSLPIKIESVKEKGRRQRWSIQILEFVSKIILKIKSQWEERLKILNWQRGLLYRVK